MRSIIVAIVALAALSAQDRPPRTVWDGVYTKEQADRGKALYNQHCGACHGEALEGIEMASALAGGEFIDKWAGQTLGDLFERIRTTMPGDKPGRLGRDVNANILAYILGANEFPAGQAELSSDTQVLKQIRIDAIKRK